MQFYNNFIEQLPQEDTLEVMVVGNKAIEFFKNSPSPNAIRGFPSFTEQHISSIAQEITRHILSVQIAYTSVIIVSNHSKTFFSQRPELTQVIPFPAISQASHANIDYTWQTQPKQLLDNFIPIFIEGIITVALFESLLAEQAARFVSMDFATRNAQKLLTEMKLQYNKVRQARITQELIELRGASN